VTGTWDFFCWAWTIGWQISQNDFFMHDFQCLIMALLVAQWDTLHVSGSKQHRMWSKFFLVSSQNGNLHFFPGPRLSMMSPLPVNSCNWHPWACKIRVRRCWMNFWVTSNPISGTSKIVSMFISICFRNSEKLNWTRVKNQKNGLWTILVSLAEVLFWIWPLGMSMVPFIWMELKWIHERVLYLCSVS